MTLVGRLVCDVIAMRLAGAVGYLTVLRGVVTADVDVFAVVRFLNVERLALGSFRVSSLMPVGRICWRCQS